jgi:preprotein translocase subunit SecA
VGDLERIGRACLSRLAEAATWRRYRLARVVQRVDRAAAGLDTLDDATLVEVVQQVRESLHRDGLDDTRIFQSFALLRELCARHLNMRPFDVQLLGAWVIVKGNMAEMATGEGKSLTAALAAATAAMAGIPVHVVTTNEYLASRDAAEMRPLYEALGLTVTVVREKMGVHDKHGAYRCDIVYCSNKQIAFDYLRDRLLSRNTTGRLSMQFSDANLRQQLLLRGLCFAIVDEADSVLIDEARTPLILSREHGDSEQEKIYAEALALATSMEKDLHYQYFPREQRLVLTAEGRRWLEQEVQGRSGIWSGQRHARHLVHQALCALHLYQRDRHYLVRDGEVVIIDRNTGRTMADRSWQRGLHQMIECKEDCSMTGQRETLSSISYQRFFRRYLHLGGMSGTLKQVRREMRSVYQHRVVSIPTHLPSRRVDLGFTLHRRESEKWLTVFAEVERVHATGQPVLVGTGSVRESELLHSLLTRRGLAHRVLNARQDRQEALIISRAGQRGQITIATSMAGRGTDIKLGEGVAALGGLHVIVTDCHEECRVDQQLYGRCARQGDPGSVSTHVSLNDALLQTFYRVPLRRFMGLCMRRRSALGNRSSRFLVRFAQVFRSAHYRAERREVMRNDENLGKMLAFSGQRE